MKVQRNSVSWEKEREKRLGYWFVVEGSRMLRVFEVMQRLYTEERMDADEMRDAAQILNSVLDSATMTGVGL